MNAVLWIIGGLVAIFIAGSFVWSGLRGEREEKKRKWEKEYERLSFQCEKARQAHIAVLRSGDSAKLSAAYDAWVQSAEQFKKHKAIGFQNGYLH